MKTLSTFCFVVALALTGTAAAQETRIAAIVNDDVLSLGDLANRVQLVMKSSSIADTQQNRDRIRSQVLRGLIDEKLELQEAKRLNVSIPKDEAEQAFSRLESQNRMEKGGLDKYLAEQGISRATLIDQLTANMTWGKLVHNRLMQEVTISDEEVSDEFKRIQDTAGTPQNRVLEIFLAVDNPAQDAEVKHTAERLIDQVRTGVSFSLLAQQFSQSPTAAVGGDLGWLTAAQMAPSLGGTVEKMEPGQMSYPIHTPAGYYVLNLVERRALGQSDPNNTLLSLVEVTLPVTPQSPVADQKRALAQVQQISATAKSCGELAKFGREHAPQTSREIPEIKAGDLPPALRQSIMALGIAVASKPLPLQGGIGVVMVCQRKEAKGGLPSRDELQESLGRQRLDALARRYLRDLRRGAYVDIRG